jgi:hypothetical protein
MCNTNSGLNLYLLSQGQNNDYDTYDSCVVAARTEEEARRIHPDGDNPELWTKRYPTWASCPENVAVELIGVATDRIFTGVMCASFNAG